MVHKVCYRWGLLLALWLGIAVGAQATNYTFPGALPAGCSGSGSSYSCSSDVTLGWGDTMTFTSGTPVTVTINGNFNTNNAAINASGAAANVSFVVTGTTTFGFQPNFNANLTSGTVTDSNGQATVGGSITATTGSITLAYKTSVAGNVTSGAGNITLGGEGTVGGSVQSNSGSISLPFRSNVTGNLSTTGAITLANESTVGGNITGSTGSVVMQYHSSVAGALTTTSGSIDIQGATANACVSSTSSAPITLGWGSSVSKVCCGTNCNSACVTNNSGASMPPLCSPTLTKTASTGAGRVGDVITFAIGYSNSLATDVTNVTVTDVLPSGMTYASAAPTTGTVAVSGQTVTWSIPIIPAGGSVQLTLAVNLVSQGVITNTVTAPGTNSASASVLVLAGAVTHYRMDEPVGAWNDTAGKVLDSGTTGLHGKRVLSGATTTTTNVIAPSPTIAAQNASVVGGFCNAGKFDGNAVVEVPSSPLFGYTNKLSASAWIYLTSYPPNGGLYSVLSNDVNYEFHVDSNGKLFWWWNASSLTSSASIPLNQWTHVAITFSSATGAGRQRIYINGVQDTATKNWTGTLQQNSCKFYVGGDVSTGTGCQLMTERNFKGNIDEVKLYNYELSAAEVQADMTLGRNCSGTYDHIRIEHDGVASVCTPETVTVKACLNASCSSLYTGAVTVQLSPSGWTGGDTITFSGGVTTRSLGVSTPGTVTLGGASTTPLAVNSAKCFNGSTQTCSMTFAAASCNFDAVEVGASPKTRLFTKQAGTAFNVDILALTGNSVNTSVNSAVNVDLVDSSATDCPSGAGLTPAQSVTLVNGRKTANFTYAQARPNVRVRVQQGASAAACSTDNFAIRPASITLVTSANATPPSATSAPAVKAGAAFTVYGTTTTGYTGSATLDASKLSAQTTTQTSTQASGGVVGTLGLASLPVNAATAPSNNATYSEAGYLYLAAGAYRDESFTSVDQPSGCAATGTCDCMTDTTSNNNLSTVSVGGKFGCHIGNTAASLGRFYPDHFAISAPAVVPFCSATASSFTYFGQDGFDTTFTMTAQNTSNGTTQNYQGAFAKFGTTLYGNYGFSAATLPAGSALSSGATAPSGSWASGVATIQARHQVSRPTAPAAETLLTVTAAPTDGEVPANATPATVGTGVRMRYGRVRMQNAYGSERLALALPIQAQYWDGAAFIRNVDDSCTALTVPAARTLATGASPDGAANVYFYPITGKNKLASGNTTRSMAATMVGGNVSLGFTAPGNAGWADVILGTPSHLRDNYGNCMGQTGTVGARDDMPCARATFGVYKSPLIYRRENY